MAIKYRKKSEKKQRWIGDDAGRALFSGSNVHFLMKNRHKIGEKSEENRSGGQYCWVMHSGSRVDVQKRKYQ